MLNLKILTLIPLLFFSTASYSIEITPLSAFRGGGDFIDTQTNKNHTIKNSEAFGIIVGFPSEAGKMMEIYYSHQSSTLNSVDVNLPSTTGEVDIPITIDYLHIGGTTTINITNDLTTFVSGGLGFTYLSPSLNGLQSDLRASLSLGIGLKWPISEVIALRLESRALGTFYNSNAALFCDGGCSLAINGSVFLQVDVFAGLVIRF